MRNETRTLFNAYVVADRAAQRRAGRNHQVRRRPRWSSRSSNGDPRIRREFLHGDQRRCRHPSGRAGARHQFRAHHRGPH